MRPEAAQRHALAQIRRDLARFELGPELQENVQQHYCHLETLTASLKRIGVDDDVIDLHVTDIFNKYKEAMLENIDRLARTPDAIAGSADSTWTGMITMAVCNVGGEAARLDALRRYDVMDTQPEEAFDRITRLAKTVLAMPMVVVSLVDQDRQWFKSRQGVEAAETARDVSFCTHTIQDTRPLIVTDALADPRFAQSPLVLGEPHIRFYIGVPLRTRDGYNVGALCSMDTEVRHLSDVQIKILEDLAKLVVDELELRLLASTDSLTGAMSRRSFHEQTNREMDRAKRYGKHLSCAVIDLDHFKSINDTYGHAAGDLVLQRVGSIIKSELRASDYLGRIGGEEFAVLFPETALMAAFEVAERLRAALEEATIEVSGERIGVTASIGVAEVRGAGLTTDILLRHADVAMYEAKLGGRNRVLRYGIDDLKVNPAGVEGGQSLTGKPALRPTTRQEPLVRLVQ